MITQSACRSYLLPINQLFLFISTVARLETEKRTGVLKRFSANASHSRTTSEWKEVASQGIQFHQFPKLGVPVMPLVLYGRWLVLIARGTLLLELKFHIYCCEDGGNVPLFKPNAKIEILDSVFRIL